MPPSSLQVRTSPALPRSISDIEVMTPAQSENEGSPDVAWGGPVRSSQENDYDMEMDDGDLDITSQPSQSADTGNPFLRPAMLNASLFGAEHALANGRIPTPIHPTFKRGGMNGLGYPASGSAGGFGPCNGGSGVPSLQAPTSCKTNRQDLDDDRNRRMPSPISENEDVPDTPTALTQSQRSQLSVSQADQMDIEVSLAPPPTPRTRKRSGALSQGPKWTVITVHLIASAIPGLQLGRYNVPF
jgi:hypothetical protein